MRTQTGSIAAGSLTGTAQAVVTGASGDQLYIDNGTGFTVEIGVPLANGSSSLLVVPAFGKLSCFGDFSGGNVTARQTAGSGASGAVIVNCVLAAG